jgi:hypothetical protein
MAWGTSGAPQVSSKVPRSKRTLVMVGGARHAKRMPDGGGAEACEIAGLVSRDPMAGPAPASCLALGRLRTGLNLTLEHARTGERACATLNEG